LFYHGIGLIPEIIAVVCANRVIIPVHAVYHKCFPVYKEFHAALIGFYGNKVGLREQGIYRMKKDTDKKKKSHNCQDFLPDKTGRKLKNKPKNIYYMITKGDIFVGWFVVGD